MPHCDWPTERSFRYQSYLQEATGLVKQNGQEAGLTEEELVAIFGWTCTDYEFIKPISWGDDEVNSYFSNAHTYCTLHRADVWPEIEVLLGALNKLPPSKPFNETLWRGWRKETPEELGRMITGGPGGFFSASRNFDVSLGFAGPTLWAIESHISGKHISDFSAFPSEDEILFPLGNRMEVVECSPTTFSNTMLQKIDERKRYSNLTVVCVKEVPAQFKTVMKEAPAQSETVMSGAPSHSQTLVV